MSNNLEIAARKKELRKLIKQRKANFSPSEMGIKSDAIFAQVERMPEFVGAKCVFAYAAMSDEVQTMAFIRKWVGRKRIVLPVVKGNDLELREFIADEKLIQSESFGILEPHGGPLVDLGDIDFAIIPGIAFDRNNNRMGRGKGYYDILLNRALFYKTGVCFDFQLVESVPIDDFDEKMDMVVIA